MKNLFLLFIGVVSGLSAEAQQKDPLLRYVDGDNTEILSDWRLKELKVKVYGFDRYSKSVSGNPREPRKTSDSYEGDYALVYETHNLPGTQRMEHKIANIDETDALRFGDEQYFGFAMKMDGSKFRDLTGSLIFWQAWQGSPYGPPAHLKFMTQKNAEGEYRVKLAIGNDDTRINGGEIDGGSIYLPKDEWHLFQIHIKPDYQTNIGKITVWVNGKVELSYSGKIGYTPDPPTSESDEDFRYDGLVCKWGIYSPGGNTGHRLFFDEIKLGKTYNSVLPTDKENLLRYVGGESTKIRIIDWRLRQPKVHPSTFDRFDFYSRSISGDPHKPRKTSGSFEGDHGLVYETNSSSEKQRIEHKFADIDESDALRFGGHRYYGFAMKMDGAKFRDLSSILIFWQAWQGSPYGPPAHLKFMTQKNAEGEHRVKLAIEDDDTRINGGEIDGGSIYLAKDKWYLFQIYVKPDYQTDNGEIIVWVNGKEELSYSGKIGYTPDPPTGGSDNDFRYDGLVTKWGIYEPNGNTGHRLVFDEIKLGKTYNSVLPTVYLPRYDTPRGRIATEESITTSIEENVIDKYSLRHGQLTLHNPASTLAIYNLNGRIVLKKENVSAVDLNSVQAGLYVLNIDGFTQKILLRSGN